MANLMRRSGGKPGTLQSKDEAVKTPPPSERRTKMPKRRLNYFRDLLIRRRRELIGDVTAMESEALRGSGSGSLSNMPLHMADVGSDTYEQEFTLQLAASEREVVREIDEALQRIADGTYGVCEETGVPIREARLEAKPWARYSIEVAREHERRGKRTF